MADPIPTPNAFTPEMQAQFNDLMALSTGRAQRQEPIHQAAMAMATRMAPSYARDAMSPVRTASTPGAAGAGAGAAAGADGGPNAKMLASFLAAMLPALASGSGDLSGLLKLFKKLFGIGGDGATVQGNKPFTGGAAVGGGQPSQYQFSGFAPPTPEPNPYDNPTANVDTSFTTSYPNDVFNDPYFLNSQWNGMPTDPSGGTGVGPGMQGYRGGNPTGRPDDPFHWPKP